MITYLLFEPVLCCLRYLLWITGGVELRATGGSGSVSGAVRVEASWTLKPRPKPAGEDSGVQVG